MSVTVTIIASLSDDTKVLLVKATSAIPSGVSSALLSLNSVSANYTYLIGVADLEILKASGTILIPFAAITGGASMINDGYYSLSITFNEGTTNHGTNIQTFAVINRLKTLYYNSVNYYDVNADIVSVKKTMKILLLLESILVLGENPGNSTDFWNRYNYVLAQLS